MLFVFFYCYGVPLDLHVLTHSFPSRRSSVLFAYPSKIELFFLLGLEASGAYLASSSSPRFVPPGADNRNKRNASPDEVGGALAGHSKARWQAWELAPLGTANRPDC